MRPAIFGSSLSGMLKGRHNDNCISAGHMIRYYITDRAALGSTAALLANIGEQMAAGIDLIQLRERDLSARELLALAEAVLRLPNATCSKLLINDRADVALASGAAGVHVRGGSVAPRRIRDIAPDGFLVGVSCHTVGEVRRAADEGASFAVLAPIFATPGKGPALGVGRIEEAVRSVQIPVLALGGVNEERARECVEAGAAGIAGISLFQGKSTG
jgi:thiamine-phosphate pyrophosphorylase